MRMKYGVTHRLGIVLAVLGCLAGVMFALLWALPVPIHRIQRLDKPIHVAAENATYQSFTPPGIASSAVCGE